MWQICFRNITVWENTGDWYAIFIFYWIFSSKLLLSDLLLAVRFHNWKTNWIIVTLFWLEKRMEQFLWWLKCSRCFTRCRGIQFLYITRYRMRFKAYFIQIKGGAWFHFLFSLTRNSSLGWIEEVWLEWSMNNDSGKYEKTSIPHIGMDAFSGIKRKLENLCCF